jgi:hypothetical protein
MRTRHFWVVFPLIVILSAFSISSLIEFSLRADFLDGHIPEISKDYLPLSAPLILVACKSKHRVPLWHARLCVQGLRQSRTPETRFSSSEILPSSAILPVALTTVLRC